VSITPAFYVCSNLVLAISLTLSLYTQTLATELSVPHAVVSAYSVHVFTGRHTSAGAMQLAPYARYMRSTYTIIIVFVYSCCAPLYLRYYCYCVVHHSECTKGCSGEESLA
jgi:hypothetical protein